MRKIVKGEELKLAEERINSSRRRTTSRWTTWTASRIEASSFLISVIYAWGSFGVWELICKD